MATAFAAASHVAAGGQVPPVLLVLLSLALSGPVCMALAGRVLSRSSLLAGVLVSQGVFHLLFTVAGSVATVADATHHAAVSSPPLGPALVLQAQDHAAHGGTGMLVFHVLGAAATYAFLRHGEVTLVGLLDALRMRVRRLWRVLCHPGRGAPAPTCPTGASAYADRSVPAAPGTLLPWTTGSSSSESSTPDQAHPVARRLNTTTPVRAGRGRGRGRQARRLPHSRLRSSARRPCLTHSFIAPRRDPLAMLTTTSVLRRTAAP
jgi:hypothetical protein